MGDKFKIKAVLWLWKFAFVYQFTLVSVNIANYIINKT